MTSFDDLKHLLETKPLRLTHGALQWLCQKADLPLADQCPFGFMKYAPGAMSDTAYTESLEIHTRGLHPSAGHIRTTSEEGSLFQLAIWTLVKPQARIRLSVIVPGEEPAVIPLFVRGVNAVLSYFDGEALSIGLPFLANRLADAIVEILKPADEPPDPYRRGMISSAQLMIANHLWRLRGQRGPGHIPKKEAMTALEALGIDLESAENVLLALQQTDGFLFDGKTYALGRDLRYWLDLLWSGHVFEIEYLQVDEKDWPDMHPQRLLFVGPPGRRVLYEVFPASELTHVDTTTRSAALDDQLRVHLFRHVERQELQQLIHEHLVRPQRTLVCTCGEAVRPGAFHCVVCGERTM